MKVDPADADNFPKMIELWFLFSMIWSICCSVDEEGRKKIDAYLREIDGSFPNKDSIYEYYVEPKTRSWIHWEEKLKQGWKLNPRFNSHLSILSLIFQLSVSHLFFHISSFLPSSACIMELFLRMNRCYYDFCYYIFLLSAG